MSGPVMKSKKLTEVMIRSIIKGWMAEFTGQLKDIERRLDRLEGKTHFRKTKQSSSVLNYKGKLVRDFSQILKFWMDLYLV